MRAHSSLHRLAAGLGLAAAALVAALLVPLSSAASSPPACQTGSLHVSYKLIPNSQGVGQIYYRLTATNAGAHACSLGRPTLKLQSASHGALPSHSHATGRAVVVPAGRKATARVKFTPDVAATGESMTGACEPLAHFLQVSFAGSSGNVITAVKPPTPVCQHGAMSIAPLRT